MQARLIIGSNNILDLTFDPEMSVNDFQHGLCDLLDIKVHGFIIRDNYESLGKTNKCIGQFLYPGCVARAVSSIAYAKRRWMSRTLSTSMMDVPLVMDQDEFDRITKCLYSDLPARIQSNNPEDPISMEPFLPEDEVFLLSCGHVLMNTDETLLLFTGIRSNCPTCGERIVFASSAQTHEHETETPDNSDLSSDEN